MCANIASDTRKELFLIYHDTITATATAKYFTFEDETAKLSGSCMLDGAVTSFNEPVISALSNGAASIFIDAVKGAGMQTEIVYCKNAELVSLYLPLTIGIKID